MKRSALVALGTLLVARMFGASLGGVVEITAAQGWKSGEPDHVGPFPTIEFSPMDNRNAALLVTLIPNELAKISDAASLRAFHQRLCTPMMGPSGRATEVIELKIRDGSGLYAMFEDPSLIGKPPKPHDYKVASPMAVWLRPDIVLQITLFTDSITGPDVADGLQMIQSAKAIGHATPVSPEKMAELARKPIMIRGPDAVLMIPSSTFKATGTADKTRNYFAFTDEKGINLSGWMDEASHFPGFRAFWTHEKSAMEQGTGFKVSDEEIKIIGSWNAVLYTIKTGNLVQRNLRACRVTGKTWADVHLSLVAIDGGSSDLENVLKTFILKRDL